MFKTGVGKLRPAWTFDMRPTSVFSLPMLEHNIASKRCSTISRYLDSTSREVTLPRG